MKVNRPACFLLGKIFLSLIITLNSGCGEKPPKITENTLAVIGARVIDNNDFAKRYQEFRQRTGKGVPDSYEARRQVLNNYIDEAILIAEAEKRGLGKDGAARQERQRIEMQELLNTYNQKMIAEKVTISDEELQTLFVRLNTRVKARHIYASSKQQADSLYSVLQAGASFEELAKGVFHDPRLRDSGGLLGYFTVDEMEPAFEEAAYNLNIGEISRPVRTTDGYSIIRVDDRITKPLLTEYEYAKHKEKLYPYWRNRKIQTATQALVDSLSKTLDIAFNEPVVKKLYALFQKRDSKNGSQEDALLSTDIDGSENLQNQELVRSNLGKWDVQTFRQKARFTSPKQHNWIKSERHFKEFISGLVVRERMLSEAKKARLDRLPQYKQKVAEKWDDYLYTRMEETLRSQMSVPEDSLLQYYNTNAQLFAAPAEINLREIVLRDEKTVNLVQRQLKKGSPFSELAKTYSVRAWSAERGGELGYVTPADLGQWSDTAFALAVGERAGPIKMDSMFVFLECIDKKASQPRTFAEARAEVETTMRYLNWFDYRRSRIVEFRKALNVKMFPERLTAVRLN
jgi:parvulin-like peptidyl-prolyl isomerase